MGGVLYFIMRHLVDSFNLLTFNKKEIDSSSSMFRKIMVHFYCGVLLLHACMISILFQKGFKSCAAFIFLVFCASVLVIIITNKNLFDIAKQD
mmetsp:Transcript_22827/g.22073  ORF Transcript_22827/g.22073 Transcript_22827/m.22073 type:complete len:93 (+) Transcript_22827:20-298(+)